MAYIIGGVTVTELVQDFEEGIGNKGPYATKAFLVPNWADRYTVANAMLGFTSYTGSVVGLHAPLVYPESANIFAREVSIKPIGAQSQGTRQIQWTSAIVEAKFGTWEQSNANDTGGQNSFDPAAPLIYATQELDFGGQFITIPRSQLKTLAGSNLDQDFGRFVGVVTLSLTLHKLPYLIGPTQRQMIGTLNVASIFQCAAGTLRLDGIKTRRTFDTGGTITQDTTYQLAYRPEAAWDKIYVKGGIWTQVVDATTASPIVPTSDFTLLIPPAYNG